MKVTGNLNTLWLLRHICRPYSGLLSTTSLEQNGTDATQDYYMTKVYEITTKYDTDVTAQTTIQNII